MKNISRDKPFFQIGQAAQLIGITSDRLRTYEEEGLIKPFRVNKKNSGKRLFSQKEIEYIILIRQAIKLGVTIPVLRILLESNIPKEIPYLKKKDSEIIEIIRKMKNFNNQH